MKSNQHPSLMVVQRERATNVTCICFTVLFVFIFRQRLTCELNVDNLQMCFSSSLPRGFAQIDGFYDTYTFILSTDWYDESLKE